MYNLKNNLIFIHIPKTAGTAISEYMYKLNGERKDIVHNVKMDHGFLGKIRYAKEYTHITFPMYKKLLNEKICNDAIKFVIVRNPINKLKSWYYFHIQNKWVNFSINKMLPILYHDLKLIESRGYSLNCDNHSDGGAVFNTFGIIRQTDYFNIKTDNVNILKFESLQKDFDEFVEKYNLPKFKINKINATKDVSTSDREFFIKLTKGHSQEMIEYIINYYKPDFNLLGYKLNV